METGPKRDSCGTETGHNADLRFDATDEASRAKAIECLGFSYLPDTVPPYSLDGWPKVPPPGVVLEGADRRAGYLDEFDPNAVPQRLVRYKDELRSLALDHVLLAFFVTDGNGISVAGVLAARDEGGVVRIARALLDENFEE